MLFYLLIIILIFIVFFTNNTPRECKIFDIKRDVFPHVNDITKYLILNRS